MIGTIDVSLDALRANANALRDFIAPAKAAFVVKSNAYGHGAAETAMAIEPYAHAICVFAIEEAAELRDGGVTCRILVMGPVPADRLGDALALNVEIALWDTGSYLRAIAQEAQRRHARFPVHVKINTGAARLGLEPRDAADAIDDYARMPDLDLAGMFSHLAAAEELDSPFTQAQLQRFEGVLQTVEPGLRAKGAHPVRHIAASAAAMLWPQTRMDMARIGIALYGLWPSPQTRAAMNGTPLQLRPALTFGSELAATRDVEAGAPIGYGCSYHAPKATRIGVVPVGYADGVPRALSNRGAFVVGGARCPIVGRVCMNLTLVDLAHAPRAVAGDRVTLIGTDGDATISAEDWAEWADTINYEIVARLPATVPRRYAQTETPQPAGALA